MEDNELNLPPNSVIVGDDAFPPRTNLLKPYSRVNVMVKQRYLTTDFQEQEEWWRMFSESLPQDLEFLGGL
jgi:hypothetical protein